MSEYVWSIKARTSLTIMCVSEFWWVKSDIIDVDNRVREVQQSRRQAKLMCT